MNSHFVPFKPNYPAPRNANELMNKIEKQIDEQIELCEVNRYGKEDDFIKANLNLIKELTQNIDNSDDIRFIEKIIATFCEIMNTQRDVIRDFSVVDMQAVGANLSQHNYVSSYVDPVEGFTNDGQIKAAFSAYMEKEGKSGFTTNDYILRVTNLWQNFEHEYRTGKLEENLLHLVCEEQISLEYPLLNAYRHIDALNRYVALNMEKNAGDRNWANIRAAINTFGKAVCGEGYKKVKVPRETSQRKDFTKYSFNGKTYGKSRLVLAVVQQYVEDYSPATFEALKEAFPDELQGSFAVVKLANDVPDKYKGDGAVKRYFVKEDEIICLSSGEQVIVCTQWGINNTELLIKHVLEYGYNIKQI